jgi:hypothetical protein
MSKVVGLLPFVPSGRDFDRSRALFGELGFAELWSAEGHVGLQCGAARFILQALDEPAFAANLMIRIDVDDLDAWWREMLAKDLPRRFPGWQPLRPTETMKTAGR